MRMVPACWRSLIAATALALALTPALAPAAPAAPEKDNAINPVEKLHKDLDKPITLKIDKQSLAAAIDALREKSKVNFVFDSVTIQQQLGFTPDQPTSLVEVDLKDVKVRNALRTILAPYGLGFALIGDTVVISTDDMAMYRQMRQRVSVDFDKVEVAAALKQISRDTAVNLILDSRVEKDAATKVSLQMEDVPLETVVRLLAEMANLKPVRVGNVLFVTGKANANEMRNDPEVGQPNPNIRAQQELLQMQLGNVAPGVGTTIVPSLTAPPGVVPVVPPADTPKEIKDIPDPKSGDDKAPTSGATKDPKEETAVDGKPLTK